MSDEPSAPRRRRTATAGSTHSAPPESSGDRTEIDAAFAYIDFANSDVHHDTTFYGGTPAAVNTALRGQVEAKVYVMSFGFRARF